MRRSPSCGARRVLFFFRSLFFFVLLLSSSSPPERRPAARLKLNAKSMDGGRAPDDRGGPNNPNGGGSGKAGGGAPKDSMSIFGDMRDQPVVVLMFVIGLGKAPLPRRKLSFSAVRSTLDVCVVSLTPHIL